MKRLRIIGESPKEQPEGWEVHNAPRPLVGNIQWEGEFRHGIFYAAIDPADSLMTGYARRENASLDAYRVEYVTKERAIEEAKEHAKEKHPEMLTASYIGEDDWLNHWYYLQQQRMEKEK